jgi:glycosyltransferase involved in cell wall biosynthesis
MKIGIVQPVVGSIGGNDNVLESLFEVFKKDQIKLFTFSKVTKSVPYNVKVYTKIPVNFPLLGIYQKFLMPQHDYSRCDVILDMTGYGVKTKLPLIIYDQNNLANSFNGVTPEKYKKGFWKLYYLPCKFLSKNKQMPKAKYISNSLYSSKELYKASGITSDIIYPCVNLEEFYSRDKQNQVCVIGRISPDKNLEQTITILNQIDYPCFIFGNVTTSNIPYLKKLKSFAHNHITFIINEPREKLLELLSQSKIFFSASKETFGIATVESIASGCVPIVPDNSANKEVVPLLGCRYESGLDAIHLINDVMDSDNEVILNILSDHIKNYTYDKFEKNFLYSIKQVMV